MFSYDGALYKMLTKISQMVLMSIFWGVASLPIITIGASTTAMFSSFYKIFRGENGSLFSDFFTAFKENFKKSTIIWLIMLVAGGILAADFWVLAQAGDKLPRVLTIILVAFAVFYIIEFSYVFALEAFYINDVKSTIKNAFFIAYANLNSTLLILIIIAGFVLLNMTIILVNIISFIIGLGALGYLIARIQFDTLKKYLPEKELATEEALES